MTDGELMEKYRLSAKGLDSAFTKLVNSGLISVEEIYGQSRSLDADTVIVDDVTILPKHFLAVSVPIHEAGSPEHKGRLTEINERGVGITGIEARIGEMKSFVIPGGQLVKPREIVFEARCLWSQPGTETGGWMTGFQITKISPEDLAQLRELIKLLTLR